MIRTLAILSTTLLLVFAGCVSPETAIDKLAGKSPQELLPHLELTDTHDHKDRASHNISWNMELLGWNGIAEDPSKFGRYNHVVVHGTLALVTAYKLEKDGKPGLAIFNISGDVPELLATLATPDLTPIDVHVSEDGKYAVLAGHRDNRFPVPAQANTCTGTPAVDACTPFVPGGVILVDITDPAAPAVVDTYTSAPSGAHTAKIVQYDSGYHVFIASYGFSYASRVASGVEVLMLTSTPLGEQLHPVARFHASEPSGNRGEARTFVHDVWIEDHPDGRKLMYVSYWDGGVVIADVSNPHQPKEVASWKEFDIAQYGNIHFARPVGVIGEPGCDSIGPDELASSSCRHITFAAPEFGSAEHAGEAYILDTTDPAAPQLIGKWVLPGDPINDAGYRFSPHNFDPQGSKIVYAHYHGGVWVVDLATPEAPVVKAYVFPTVPDHVPAFEATEDAPNIWAAVWADDGTIYASDIGTGLYHYRMVSEEPGVPPYVAALG